MPLTATAIGKAKPREEARKLCDIRALYLEIAPPRRVSGVGHPQGADDDISVPGDGAQRVWTR